MSNKILKQHEHTFRVRYQETDAQGRVHHANFLNYFEIGRVEQLRASGVSYKSLESEGILLVVANMECEYFLPAEYDDLLCLHTNTVRAKGARIEHEYQLFRDKDLLVKGRSIIACVNPSGRVQRLPDWMILSD